MAAVQVLNPIARRLGRRRSGPLLFAFNGGAGSFAGMGADLFAAEPAFRATVERAAAVVRDEIGFDALPAFTDRVPPAIKVEVLVLLGLVQLAQCELWRDAGVEPRATLGLSLGEAGAAYAAGALTFEDAVRVICAIGEGSRHDRDPHALFILEGSFDDASALCAEATVAMAVAGSLSTDATTVLAPEAEREAARAHIERRAALRHEGTAGRASHTELAPSVRPKFERLLAGIDPRPPERPCFLASLGGQVPPDTRLDAAHWTRMHDRSFRYAEAADAALALAPALVVQIGVNPHTVPYVEAAAHRARRRVPMVQTTRGARPELESWGRAKAAVARERPRA